MRHGARTHHLLRHDRFLRPRVRLFSARNLLIMGGAILGASPLCAAILAARCGRRATIVIASRAALLACVLSAFLTFSVDVHGEQASRHAVHVGAPLYYMGRALTGFCSGIFSSVVPMYQAELAPAKARGRFGSTYQVAYQLGGLSAYITIRILLLPKCVNVNVGVICVQLLQGAAFKTAAHSRAHTQLVNTNR